MYRRNQFQYRRRLQAVFTGKYAFLVLLFLFCSIVSLQAQLKASFTADTVQGCAPLLIHFTSTATGDVANWLWTTSDGQTSTEENPSFVFSKPGKLRIRLRVSDYTAADSTYHDVIINGIPTAFTYQYNTICTSPVPVQFHVYDTSGAANYHWNFGDSTVSIQTNPSHTYTYQGSYSVHLVTYSPEGCIDSSLQTVQTGQVTVDFTAPASLCSNSSVFFTSTASSLPKSAVWTVNGVVESHSHIGFSYTFGQPGTYTINLTEDFGGCTYSQQKTILVLQKPTASFTQLGTLQTCLYPSAVQFTNTSQNAGSYTWFFGDADSSVEVSPLHNYTVAGQFSPLLIAVNADGCADTFVKQNLILLGPPIISRLQGFPASHCLPDTIKTRASLVTPEPIASYDWSWGDSNHSPDSVPTYIYTKQGFYNVSLMVKTKSGCTGTFAVTDALLAGDSVSADFTVNKNIACASDSFHFSATPSRPGNYQWLWYFGDLTPYSNLQNPVHLFTSTGYKTVFVQVNNNGCYLKTTKNNIVFSKPPVAGIHVTYDCKNQLNVSFTDTCQQAFTWHWNFGDGSPAATVQTPPLHSYAGSGIYTVRLSTTNGACASTDTILVPILNTKPIFTFNPANTSLCRKQGVWMSATNPEYIADYYWNFDDGRSAFSDTAIYNFYSTTGTYHPSLVTKYKNGCYDTVFSPHPVVINGPTALFQTKAAINCLHTATVFSDKSVSDGTHPIIGWWWNCGDAYSLKNTSPAFSYTYAKSGAYLASLLVTDANNCTDTAYYNLTINSLPPVSAGADTFVCEGNTVALSASGALSYVWQPDATLSCTACSSTVASPQVAPHSYTVTGTGANGCVATDSTWVNVIRPFNLSVSSDGSSLCQNAAVRLIASGADEYTWQPSIGLSDAGSASPIASPLQTTTYRVTGSDRHHCFSGLGSVSLTVYPNPVFSIRDSFITVQKGDVNIIATTGSTDITAVHWSPSPGLSCTDCLQPLSTAVKTVTYTATATTSHGCTATDQITVHVLCNGSKIYLPTGFTPNGDGKNDYWYVVSDVDNPLRSFSIWGRNGERIFYAANGITNNPAQGWDGRCNGVPASPGSYVYRIEVLCNGEVVSFTGTVTLLR